MDRNNKTIAVTIRKARKEHRCYCGLPILPGTSYERTVGVVDGEIRVWIEACHRHADGSCYGDQPWDDNTPWTPQATTDDEIPY